MLKRILGYIGKSRLEKTAAKAKAGDRRAHDALISGIIEKKYTVTSVTASGAGAIAAGGNIENSILITGDNNKIIKLDEGKYQWFSELVSTAVSSAVKDGLASQTVNAATHRGASAVFQHEGFDHDLDAIVRYIAGNAQQGDISAGEVIHQSAQQGNLTLLLDHLRERIATRKISDEIVVSLCNLSWSFEGFEQFKSSVELAEKTKVRSDSLKIARASIEERAGNFKEAAKILKSIIKSKDKVTESNADAQGFARHFLAHLFEKNSDQFSNRWKNSGKSGIARLRDEAIEIYDEFSSVDNDFSERVVQLRRKNSEAIGALAGLESPSSRDACFHKAKEALKSGEATVAKHLLLKCYRIDKYAGSFGNLIEDVLQLAETEMELGHFKQAGKCLNELIDLNQSAGCLPGERGAIIRVAELSKEIARKEIRPGGFYDLTDFRRHVDWARQISLDMGDKKGAKVLAEWRDEESEKEKEIQKMMKLAEHMFPEE